MHVDWSDRYKMSDRTFIRRVLIFLALSGLALLLWQMRGLLLVIFGAVVVAVILRALAEPIRRYLGFPGWLALSTAVLLITVALVAALWMFGEEVSAQVVTLAERLPDAWRALQAQVNDRGLGAYLDDLLAVTTSNGSEMLSGIGDFAMALGQMVAYTVVIVVGGIYLAAQPRLYRRGTIKLVPPGRRELVDEALEDSGRALGMWLKGQLVSMILVGLVVGIGLWLIGVPSALALGLLAGLLEFVPLAGPIVAAIPALLLAASAGWDAALWTLALYVVVQQVEGNLIQPLVQRQAVDLPPVLLLFSLLGAGTLFGVVGVILAAPLTVVIYVLVKRLYVREALHTDTPIPGEVDSS